MRDLAEIEGGKKRGGPETICAPAGGREVRRNSVPCFCPSNLF